ncbi:replicative DNA helicase [Alkalibacter saccharofermentans]|uniref:Replicative DNA helicase n=1 Tax=Alkalibacter saccharofermentans DSM 14828 TaxID=1120975 RepID=A0A1M4ZIT0_9FIRM|nr:DnaB-like helicase C-terminal domain-containing protein [Alkalibacter saccharofermentans]SHF17707.1 Replicative DNA helicase [Alkalibacter saccharofermentans DSM 14828]
MDLSDKTIEENILGALLTTQPNLDFDLKWFTDKDTLTIAKAIKDLRKEGIKPDFATVTRKAKANGNSILPAYIGELISSTMPVNIEGNIKTLKKIHTRRTTIELLREALNKLATTDEDVDLINTALAHKIDTVTINEDYSDDISSVAERFEKRLKSHETPEERQNYFYGIYGLDRLTNGLHPSELTTIAAKSGIGKTALALQVAGNFETRGKKALFISREMSDTQILARMLSPRARLDASKFRAGTKMSSDEWGLTSELLEDMKKKKNLFINDQVSTVTGIKKRIRALKPDLVIIDYLQLLTAETNEASREREVATISREIKIMTQEFKIPIIQLSQLNDEMGDHRPKGERVMRESKAIYQNSNNVIYIHKPTDSEKAEWTKANETTTSEFKSIKKARSELVEIILDKQRDGATGRFLNVYQGEYLRFISLSDFRDSLR